MNKKILITGGTGFIGKSLVEYFSTQYFFPLRRNIWAPSSKELNLLDGPAVEAYLREHQFDIIIHAATYDAVPEFSTKDVTKQAENNLKMYFNLARCKTYFHKMIYFGSGAVYDRNHLKPKMKEEYFDQHIPMDQYGFSKYVMTKYTQTTNYIYNLRIFGVFGKFDDWRYRFISNACCKAVFGLPITIKQNVYFDYIYVQDLMRLVDWFIENDTSERVFNASGPVIVDYKTIAEKIKDISGKDLNIIIEKPELREEYSGDNSLLVSRVKDFHYTTLDKSLQTLYNWYDTHRHIINPDEFAY